MVALTIASMAACWAACCVGRNTAASGGSKRYFNCCRKSSTRRLMGSWTAGTRKTITSARTATNGAIQTGLEVLNMGSIILPHPERKLRRKKGDPRGRVTLLIYYVGYLRQSSAYSFTSPSMTSPSSPPLPLPPCCPCDPPPEG